MKGLFLALVVCSVAGNGAERERGPGLWGLGIALRGGFCMFFSFLFLL